MQSLARPIDSMTIEEALEEIGPQVKDQQKAYYQAHKEKLKDQQKAYRQAHKEKLKDQKKARDKEYRNLPRWKRLQMIQIKYGST